MKLNSILERVTHGKTFHRGHALVHTGYFTLVAFEGHGLYATAGGVMAVFTVLLSVTGQE